MELYTQFSIIESWILCLHWIGLFPLTQLWNYHTIQMYMYRFFTSRVHQTSWCKPWNKPAGTRGNLHFKIAPGSWGFGMNQGQVSKYRSMFPKQNKLQIQRDRFSLVFITKTSKITTEGKFTANVRISVVYYIFVTYRHGRILRANCCAR